MWVDMNGKQVWRSNASGKHGLNRRDPFSVKRYYTEEEMGPAPQGAWWGRVIPGVVFLGIVAYFMYKLATMQP
jgi:hypothetical protein